MKTYSPLLPLLLASTLIATGFAARQFTQLALPTIPVTPRSACETLQKAYGQARWDAPGRGGYLYGDGSLLLQQCKAGIWTLQIKATPMDGEAPHLLISRGGQQIVEQDMSGTSTQRISVAAGQPLVFVAPNTRIVLEDRNLYIRNFHFKPSIPCLQDPATLSSNNVGSSDYRRFDLLSNGSVNFTACGNGNISFLLQGSETAHIGPLVKITLNGRTIFFGYITSKKPKKMSFSMNSHESLKITFLNDYSKVLKQRVIVLQSVKLTE